MIPAEIINGKHYKRYSYTKRAFCRRKRRRLPVADSAIKLMSTFSLREKISVRRPLILSSGEVFLRQRSVERIYALYTRARQIINSIVNALAFQDTRPFTVARLAVSRDKAAHFERVNAHKENSVNIRSVERYLGTLTVQKFIFVSPLLGVLKYINGKRGRRVLPPPFARAAAIVETVSGTGRVNAL